MKKLIFLLFFICGYSFGQNADSEIKVNQAIQDYYLQVIEVERQQKLIESKLELLRTINQCIQLGFDCSDYTNLDLSTLNPLPTTQKPQIKIKPRQYAKPTVVGIVNKTAVVIDYDNPENTMSLLVGDQLKHYKVQKIGTNFVIFTNKNNQQKIKQAVQRQFLEKTNSKTNNK